MSWATTYVSRLLEGRTVQFRPRGNSMTGRIASGQLVTVEPIKDHAVLRKGDIVLCKVQGSYYLHLIDAVKIPGQLFQIANNRGYVNGTAHRNQVYGICTKVE